MLTPNTNDVNLFDYPVRNKKVIAVATDTYLSPKVEFPDPQYLPSQYTPRFGQDISYAYRKTSPKNYSVGNDVRDLKKKMRLLLSTFAKGDKNGMATRLFDRYLTKLKAVSFFTDNGLNNTASAHPNIKDFCERALSPPNYSQQTPNKVRIHKALKNAGWDINKIVVPTDLGVPAFNLGSKAFTTRDFNNGLGVMINGIQHVYIVATHYYFDQKLQRYLIRLQFIFYDVFGLDDDDLIEFGASSDGWINSSASIGISAWWQLQHQHAFAPLVTRILVEKTYTVAAR